MAVMVVATLLTVTSAGGYLVGRDLLGLPGPYLRSAIRQMLGCLGVSLGFAAANLLIGMAAILVFRETTGTFVSLYIMDDATLILASLLQGIVFFRWCQLGIRGMVGGEVP